MATCREMTELVTDFLERKLGTADVLRFRLHLLGCRGCRAFLEQMRQTIQILRRLARPE